MKRQKIYSRHRRLGFESLEQRTVLSVSFPAAGEPQTLSPPAAFDIWSAVFQPAAHVTEVATDDSSNNSESDDLFGNGWAEVLRLDDVRKFPASANAGLLLPRVPVNGDANFDVIRVEPAREESDGANFPLQPSDGLGDLTEPAFSTLQNQGIADLTPRPNLLPLVSDVRLFESANTTSKDVPQEEFLSNELNAPLRPQWAESKPAVFARDESKDTTTLSDSDDTSEDRQRDELEDGEATSLFWEMALAGFLSTE